MLLGFGSRVLSTCPEIPAYCTSIGVANSIINSYWAGTDSPAAGSFDLVVIPRNVGQALSFGDKVLIIQMQDADFDSTSTTGFTNFGNTGLYEFAYVQSYNIGSATLTITTPLVNSYSTFTPLIQGIFSRYQVVRIPVCQGNAALGASVKCDFWDGSTGGIFALVTQSFAFNGFSISCDGSGFRGGAKSTQGSTNVNCLASTIQAQGALKGEGICGRGLGVAYSNGSAVFDVNYYSGGPYCRGSPGNAGGGGSATGEGGGGGSNIGNGGDGGTVFGLGYGFGAAGIAYSANRLIMGLNFLII